VQTANQKILHTELKNLLDTISISASELQILRDASLSQIYGIKAVEATLSQLYTAMLMIDPQLRHNGTRANASDRTSIDASSITGLGGSTLSSIRAVREKKEGYARESTDFVQRFKQYMSIKFRGTEVQITSMLEQRKSSSKPRELTHLDFRLREEARARLWLYSPLMLFTRELNPLDWNDIMRMYDSSTRKPYQDEIQDHLAAWKAITRRPLGEEDCLFTTPEKDSESIVGRKLTVKRAKTVRSDGTSRISTSGKPQDGKVNAYEAFAGALSETARIILVEQNFIVDYFHLSSLENLDFVDAITTSPEARKGGSPTEKKTFDPDRNMAKKVLRMMEEIFYFWPTELQNLVDWVTKQETL
jgi:exocyst complex component 1